MKQFIKGAEWAWNELESKAVNRCIRFKNMELPFCCIPDRANVGFEIDSQSNAACLFVQNGVRYNGSNAELSGWFRNGVIRFSNFDQLKDWITGPLNQAFCSQTRSTQTLQSDCNGTAEQLTDLIAVHEGIRNIHSPLYLDETVLLERLQRKIVGQDYALKGLVAVIARHIARRQPARPAVLYAVGPSGVGKTLCAEVMSQVLREFDDENNGYQYLRLDMTEYQEASRVSQLIGSPQGYVGHGEGSQLTDALKANPRTIVLADEIDKANRAVLRVFMNIMDSGRLSTASLTSTGREIDCRHAVIMFTSNLESKAILDELDSRSAFGNREIEDEVCRRRLHSAGIAPEIVGRIGRFLVFRPLSHETCAEIVALDIAEVAKEYGLRVTYIEPSVVVSIVQKVTRSKSFGARPGKFLIDEVFGSTFANTAKQGISSSVSIIGPPYECIPIT